MDELFDLRVSEFRSEHCAIGMRSQYLKTLFTGIKNLKINWFSDPIFEFILQKFSFLHEDNFILIIFILIVLTHFNPIKNQSWPCIGNVSYETLIRF